MMALSCHGDDVTIAALAVAAGAAQGVDLNLQIRRLDERLRPGPSRQFFLADHFSLDQSGENLEGRLPRRTGLWPSSSCCSRGAGTGRTRSCVRSSKEAAGRRITRLIQNLLGRD